MARVCSAYVCVVSSRWCAPCPYVLLFRERTTTIKRKKIYRRRVFSTLAINNFGFFFIFLFSIVVRVRAASVPVSRVLCAPPLVLKLSEKRPRRECLARRSALPVRIHGERGEKAPTVCRFRPGIPVSNPVCVRATCPAAVAREREARSLSR